MDSKENTSKPRKSRKFIPIPFEYHEIIKIKIDSLTNHGVGVARVNNQDLNNWVIFIPFALPGELVEAKIYANKKNYSEADLEKVLIKSPDRIEPKCQYFGKCGGCQYQNLSYKTQLEWKKKQIEEIFEKALKSNITVSKIFSSPMEFGYRSKLTPHFKKPREEKIKEMGFLQASSRSRLIDVSTCIIADEVIDKKYSKVRQEIIGKSILKKGGTILLRSGLKKNLIDREAYTGTDSECIEKVCGITFRFSTGSFFQNNPYILEDFASYVRELAKKSNCSYLLDTYCGCGFFGLICANLFNKVLGIESDSKSIDFAKKNAKSNNIENVDFLNTDSANIFEGLNEKGYEGKESLVIIDPPRRGCSDVFLNRLKEFSPKNIIYISCYPATLARDVKILFDHGYSLEDLSAFDMFPQTKHIESIAFLKLR